MLKKDLFSSKTYLHTTFGFTEILPSSDEGLKIKSFLTLLKIAHKIQTGNYFKTSLGINNSIFLFLTLKLFFLSKEKKQINVIIVIVIIMLMKIAKIYLALTIFQIFI